MNHDANSTHESNKGINMNSNNDSQSNRDLIGQVEAIRRSQAVIEFNMDGTILDANDLFLNAMGYSLDEVKGKHHSIFVEPEYKDSQEYKDFWSSLNRGEFQASEYKRLAKGGREIWIQATYNPILDENGKAYKVIKFATDITKQTNLFQSSSRMQSALEASQTASMMVDRDLLITYCNAATYTLLGKLED